MDGLPLSENRDAIKKRIGYVPDSPDIFLNLTAREYWYFLVALDEVAQTVWNNRFVPLAHLC